MVVVVAVVVVVFLLLMFHCFLMVQHVIVVSQVLDVPETCSVYISGADLFTQFHVPPP